MKKKILIIGKNSFISFNLKNDLKKAFLINTISFENFLKKKKNYLSKYNHIINCAINQNYNKRKYLPKYDLDLRIAKKIQKLDLIYVLISTRKIYKIGNNLKENSKLDPKCNYSKNKLITEKKLTKLLNDKLLILRVANLIGFNKGLKKRKVHNTFINYFFENIKKGFIYDNKKNYKDFLSTKQFSKIIEILIKKNSLGIFNVSIGKRISLNQLVNWLNSFNKEIYTIKKLPKKFSNQNFYLNNAKLTRETKLKINLTNLKKDCKRISKMFFKMKNKQIYKLVNW